MDKSRILLGGHGGDSGTNPSNTMKSKKNRLVDSPPKLGPDLNTLQNTLKCYSSPILVRFLQVVTVADSGFS